MDFKLAKQVLSTPNCSHANQCTEWWHVSSANCLPICSSSWSAASQHQISNMQRPSRCMKHPCKTNQVQTVH